MPMVRIALVSNATKTLKLPIQTGDDIGWWELGTKTDPKVPEVFLLKQKAGTWDAVIEPGHIYGFVTEKGAKVTEDPSIEMYYANGKDPWPKPPPPPPPVVYKGVTDFDTRFNSFLLAASVDEPEIPVYVAHEPGERPMIFIRPGQARHTT